ncbi:hypothetical protein C9374_001229 [Naegleria lovaniensis]|uniref:Uncharacterized protein n=1 Tax=Naegleria lovaniensis TaxID=51637 RepID=A0AA88GRP4_NAELO|nr:uncharacterized protein C9374_001229 [Naegleria lovaniensis]KAG2387635.1 hypothetical protein C9374_001229 [Naegleria lovaniensis]
MPPSLLQETHRTFDHIEKAAKDTTDKILEFDIKLCPWEQLLSKYCILNKNLETIQTMMKKDDSNFRMALLHPKDATLEGLTQQGLPQITSNNPLSFTFANQAEQIEKRIHHDDLATFCHTLIDKEYKKPSGSLKKKEKASNQPRVFKFEEAKSLLQESFKQRDASIRKQQKMRKNTIMDSILTGRDLIVSGSDIQILRDLERRSVYGAVVKRSSEDIFRSNIPPTTSTVTTTSGPIISSNAKIKISTIPNASMAQSVATLQSSMTPTVKKEEPSSAATPVAQDTKGRTKKSTPSGTARQSAKKSPNPVTAPSPTVGKTPSPSTATLNTATTVPPFATPSAVNPMTTTPTGGAINTPQIVGAGRGRLPPTGTALPQTPKNMPLRPSTTPSGVANVNTSTPVTATANARPISASPNTAAITPNLISPNQQSMLLQNSLLRFPNIPNASMAAYGRGLPLRHPANAAAMMRPINFPMNMYQTAGTNPQQQPPNANPTQQQKK